MGTVNDKSGDVDSSALLIAAAPDLLDACTAALDALTLAAAGGKLRQSYAAKVAGQLRAAVGKATAGAGKAAE